MKRTFLTVLILASGAGLSADSAAGLTHTDVFVSGRDGYHTFRIPGVVVTVKGTVLAFCEGRKNSGSDTGDIDTVLRRCLDGGKSWQPLQVVADDGPHTLGNPCPVVDRATGTIWLFLTRNHGEDRQKEIEAGTSREPRTVWVTNSQDDGVTWSKPAEISGTARKTDWGWYATGPCNAIQLKSGRLVVPCHHTPAGSHVQHAHVIYSDDHGKTWKLGGITGPNCGESSVAELADGSLLMSIRGHPKLPGKRVVTTSKDAGLTWSDPVLDESLIDPGCQGSILRYSTRPMKDRLLFSNPASTKREKMTVRVSYDEGKSWPVARVLHDGPASYSCLAVLADGTIGCLYERGQKRISETVAFARLSLDWLTGGKDRPDP